MIEMRASQIANVVNGKLVGDDLILDQPAVINSLDAFKGSIFLAFRGEHFDGHDFVHDAFANGALLAITSQEVQVRHIQVADVSLALMELATYVRSRLTDLTVIGITGSQGKTTTKDLLSQLLAGVGPTVAPYGNFNNEIGVPLTLLECNEETRFCIVEMGARHVGDLSKLCDIAKPSIGVVLKVGTAHIGEFGSREMIAKTKSELIHALPESGVAVIGLYDEFTAAMAKIHPGKVLTFGEVSGADIRAADIEIREGRPHFDLVTPGGRTSVGMRIVGIHQISNALAVAAIGTALGISLDHIATSLSTAEIQSRWRMEVHEFDDVLMINDSYNASPESMVAALRTLILFAQERGGQSWAFLGKMGELGQSSADEHARIGTLTHHIGVDHLICVGAPEYARDISSNSTTVHLANDRDQALEISRQCTAGDVILIKASRSEHLELLAEEIELSRKVSNQ